MDGGCSLRCGLPRHVDGNVHDNIEPVGTIDCFPVWESVTEVVEEGRQAFPLRQKEYGFSIDGPVTTLAS